MKGAERPRRSRSSRRPATLAPPALGRLLALRPGLVLVLVLLLKRAEAAFEAFGGGGRGRLAGALRGAGGLERGSARGAEGEAVGGPGGGVAGDEVEGHVGVGRGPVEAVDQLVGVADR